MNSSNDRTEFIQAYTRLRKPVYNYVLRMVREKQQCEDMVQNAFLKLFEHYPQLRDRERVAAWIFRTVRNDVFQYFRTKQTHVDRFNVRDVDTIREQSPDNPEKDTEALNVKDIVRGELDKLPVEQKDVFLLREYGGLSYQEIADLQGTDIELVRSRLHKARAKLIDQIKRIIT